jgi:hypothetical protein
LRGRRSWGGRASRTPLRRCSPHRTSPTGTDSCRNPIRHSRNRDLNARGVEAAGPSCHSIPKTDAPASPTIDIVSPTLDKPLTAPLDINVKFIPAGADVIQPSTFRLCYMARFMTIDITDKIADKVTVLPEGLHVAGADLPSGHHHLVMLIGDQSGHVGRREATFDIK